MVGGPWLCTKGLLTIVFPTALELMYMIDTLEDGIAMK
jgi:hypothetical protein